MAKTNETTTRKAGTAEQSENPKFYSPDKTPIRVELPDGGIALVEEKPRHLPPKFWRAATKAGCLVQGGLTARELEKSIPKANPQDDQRTKEDMIVQAMVDAGKNVDNAEYDGAFTAQGVPQVRWLETRLGFNLGADERDAAWAIAQVELDALEKDGDDDADNNND